MKFFSLLLLLLWTSGTNPLFAQQYIDVQVIGLSDGIRNSKQRDREEAIINAKLQAIEKAGVNIKSITTVKNFMLERDWIESKAEAILQPGFRIIDVGYGEDGIYKVVLIGKVSSSLISPKLVKLKIFSKLGGEAFVDGSKVGDINKDKGLIVDDLSQGLHHVLVKVPEYGIPIRPEYKLKFKHWQKDIFLKIGQPNSVEVSGLINIYNYIKGKKLLFRGFHEFSDGEGCAAGEKVFNKYIEFKDREGNNHEILIDCYFKNSRKTFLSDWNLTGRYWIKVDGKIWEGKVPSSYVSYGDYIWKEVVNTGLVKLLTYKKYYYGCYCGIELYRADLDNIDIKSIYLEY